MPIFTCPKCNKQFNRKSNFVYHIDNKKRPCTTLNIIIAPIVSVLTPKNPVIVQNDSVLAPIVSDLSPIISSSKNTYQNNNIIDDLLNIDHNNKINSNICSYCDTVFTRKTNLQRHMKDRCKSKNYCNELEELKEKFNFIMKENKLLKKSSNNSQNINNITNNNTSNTLNKNTNQINNGIVNNNNSVNIVQLVQFGNENMDDIDIKEAFNTYLNSTGGNIVSNVLKLTNFNKKYPENHNICITDLSRELVKIYNGTKFITKKFKNVKGDILNKVVKNTHKMVNKFENDKTIKKTQDTQSKMKINNVSLKLIDGQIAEDIVRDEIREKDKLLTNNKKIVNKKNNFSKIDYSNSDTDSELEEDREFNLEERLRIKYLENKQNGLINIAHERIKDELYNNKTLIIKDK